MSKDIRCRLGIHDWYNAHWARSSHGNPYLKYCPRCQMVWTKVQQSQGQVEEAVKKVTGWVQPHCGLFHMVCYYDHIV